MAHLRQIGLQASTISTYISSVRYIAKHQGLGDPGDHFLVSTALSGLAKMKKHLDIRMPVTIPILSRLIKVINSEAESAYKRVLFRAMVSLAFFAFLRVGEFTAKAREESPLLLSDLSIDLSSPQSGMSILIRKYKHSDGRRPFLIEIKMQGDPSLCPVRSIASYMAFRPPAKARSLFVKSDGNPVNRNYFSSNLASYFKACGLDPSLFKGHSFRIGAASWAAENGFSDAQIQQLGRWHSNAFKKYIRNSSITL